MPSDPKLPEGWKSWMGPTSARFEHDGFVMHVAKSRESLPWYMFFEFDDGKRRAWNSDDAKNIGDAITEVTAAAASWLRRHLALLEGKNDG